MVIFNKRSLEEEKKNVQKSVFDCAVLYLVLCSKQQWRSRERGLFAIVWRPKNMVVVTNLLQLSFAALTTFLYQNENISFTLSSFLSSFLRRFFKVFHTKILMYHTNKSNQEKGNCFYMYRDNFRKKKKALEFEINSSIQNGSRLVKLSNFSHKITDN